MKTIMLVFGTRPEAIKMCPLVIEMKKREDIRTVVCVTGQHREMLDDVLRVFAVVPDYDLGVMREEQTLSGVTSAVLCGMERVIAEVKPDLVLVHGDTTTAFAAGLAAFYAKIPVGHVEAGLRTGDLYAPFPEEFNRLAVSAFATYHFCADGDRANESPLRRQTRREHLCDGEYCHRCAPLYSQPRIYAPRADGSGRKAHHPHDGAQKGKYR